MLSFLIQSATGLGRLYSQSGWGKGLVGLFGGYEAALQTHIYVGIFMLCGFALHAVYILLKVNWKKFPASLFGPDSILPQFKDIRQFVFDNSFFMRWRKISGY